MSKVTIEKILHDTPADIPGLGKVFMPTYRLLSDDKLLGEYTNIYEATREAERQADLESVAVKFSEAPEKFLSVIPKPDQEKEALLLSVKDKVFKAALKLYEAALDQTNAHIVQSGEYEMEEEEKAYSELISRIYDYNLILSGKSRDELENDDYSIS